MTFEYCSKGRKLDQLKKYVNCEKRVNELRIFNFLDGNFGYQWEAKPQICYLYLVGK